MIKFVVLEPRLDFPGPIVSFLISSIAQTPVGPTRTTSKGMAPATRRSMIPKVSNGEKVPMPQHGLGGWYLFMVHPRHPTPVVQLLGLLARQAGELCLPRMSIIEISVKARARQSAIEWGLLWSNDTFHRR